MQSNPRPGVVGRAVRRAARAARLLDRAASWFSSPWPCPQVRDLYRTVAETGTWGGSASRRCCCCLPRYLMYRTGPSPRGVYMASSRQRPTGLVLTWGPAFCATLLLLAAAAGIYLAASEVPLPKGIDAEIDKTLLRMVNARDELLIAAAAVVASVGRCSCCCRSSIDGDGPPPKRLQPSRSLPGSWRSAWLAAAMVGLASCRCCRCRLSQWLGSLATFLLFLCLLLIALSGLQSMVRLVRRALDHRSAGVGVALRATSTAARRIAHGWSTARIPREPA